MFSRSADVKDAASILDSAPKYSIHYTSLFALRLIRASKPGLLHNSKLLPEPVWQQRTTVCLVALYYLSRDVEKILFHSREIVAGFFPIFQLAESWTIIAERYLNPATESMWVYVVLMIGAQCIATLIASRPLDNQMQVILMRRAPHF